MLAFVISLAVALAPVPAALSPEAGEHNTKAMQFYDNRQFEPAFEEFQAAYNTMPDPRRDRAGRELLLGSMRATLLDLYDATGEPGPLCRLQAVLQTHLDALTTAFPEDLEMLEIRSARARHEEVTQQLAGIGPDVCAPPPAPVITASPPAPPASTAVPLPAKIPTDHSIPPRQLRIAGGVTFGLGAALLGGMTYGIVVEAQRKAQANTIDAEAAARPLTTDEYTKLLDLRGDALTARYVAIGEGCDDGNDVLGDGCQYCARDSIIFISSASYQGFALGGVLGADQRCRSLAAKAGLMRFETFRAWLSTPTDAVVDRLLHSRGRYLLVNGLAVANDWDALISGTLDNPIMVDEYSQTQDLPVWTGTQANGQPALGSEFCGNWDDDSKFDAFGPSGLAASVDSTWSFYEQSPCILAAPIYCVEQ